MHHRIPYLLVVALLVASCSQSPAQQTTVMDPREIQLSPYHHDELPTEMLTRIRATTETFQSVDGVTYEEAVDLYRRDINPEENLVLWEEMAGAYREFCKSRCSTPDERMDVYRTLLLRSMFSPEETLARSTLKSLSSSDAEAVMQLYDLPPKPIDVVHGK
jgi:hypothetical protein